MLRTLIREMILELYSPTQEDLDAVPAGARSNAGTRRALGLQSKEEQEEDRAFVRQMQQRMQQMGSEMIELFRNGEVSCCHSIRYEGFAMGAGAKKPMGKSKNPFKTWLSKYGKSGKNMISCIAFPEPPGFGPRENPEATDWANKLVWNGEWAHERFPGMVNSCGFYLKGYPVIVSLKDVMSQTLGALPQGLVDHQKASGVAKRAGRGSLDDMILSMAEFEEAGWAGEVLLDNWSVIGIYINADEYGIREDDFWNIHVRNAAETGLEVHLFNGEEPIGHLNSPEEIENIRKQAVPGYRKK